MPYPTIYDVTYSYSGFQQAQGDNSFPGTQLDADLAGLDTSISNLALFTRSVMRSDGALNNGIVTYDSLSPALQTAGLAPATAWTTGVSYAAGVAVTQASALYRAAVAHTAGVFATDLAAGKWTFVVALPSGAPGNDGAPGDFFNYETKASVVAAIIPAETMFLHISGFYAKGDGGGGHYVRKTALDAGAFGFQSADGAWWQLVPNETGWVSVRQTGARGDGSTNDTVAVQAACNVAKNIWIPAGQYITTATIQVRSSSKVVGAGMLIVRIQRQGVWTGPTFQAGAPDGSLAGSECVFSDMLIEQLHPGFVLGVSTTMVDQLTQEQAHIDCYGGYQADFKNLWLQHGVYGIRLFGCVNTTISKIRSYGAWDNKTPAVCEQKAVICLATSATPGHLFCTEIHISDCMIGSGAPSPNRTITVGTDISYSAYENVGAKAAIVVFAVEGLSILNSYVGGCAEDCIQFFPSAITSMIRIDGCFLDECYRSNICFYSGTAGAYTTNVSIGPNNLFNGQMHTRNAIRAENNAGSFSVTGLNIHGGVFANHLEAAIVLENAQAVCITAPMVGAYNVKGSTDNNARISAGLYLAPACREIHVNGGLWGGGINDWSASNSCKWGVYMSTSGTGSVCNLRANLGLAGGSAVGGGMSQTYPT